MIFPTRINGIPCQCEVLNYETYVPMRSYGPAMEDAMPPEGGEFDFQILDRKGYQANWLDKYITPQVEMQLFEEFMVARTAERYDIDY